MIVYVLGYEGSECVCERGGGCRLDAGEFLPLHNNDIFPT